MGLYLYYICHDQLWIMTPLDTQQLKICLSKYIDIKAESTIGGIKAFYHNGVANCAPFQRLDYPHNPWGEQSLVKQILGHPDRDKLITYLRTT